MNRTRWIKIALLLAICLGLSTMASPSFGQQGLTPQQRRQLQAQIDNLKQRILQVEQLLQAFDSNAARTFLQQAKELGQQIETEFRQGRYSNAQALIRTANSTLDRILAIATDGTLKRLINELQRVMRQADFEVIGGGNKDAERMLQSARKSQERAEMSLQAGKIQKAYEQITVAITFAKQALDLVRNTCQRERAQFQNLVARAQTTIDAAQDIRAKSIYEQAFRSFTLAEQACQEGRNQAAGQLYNRAMRLLLRAINQTSAGSATLDAASIQQELDTVKDLLASVKIRIDVNEDRRGELLLRRAQENIGKAETMLGAGQPSLAKAQLALARRLLENILRIGISTTDDLQEKAESELAMLQQDINQFEGSLPADTPNLVDYLGFARQAATQAEQAIAAGRFSAALQRILVAQKFLAKADNTDNRRNRLNVTDMLVQQNINELRQRLTEAETAMSDLAANQASELLEDARSMLRQAANKRQEGKLLLAFELSEIGKELIATALRASQSRD